MSAVIESAGVGAQPLGYTSDELLISRLRADDDDAFAVLVGRYERQLLAFCRRMLGSREDAEDVLQDTFAAAYKAIRADERVIDPRPWLFQIARNRCLNAIRGRRPTQPLGTNGLEPEALLGTAEQVARRVEFNLVVNDILALPDQQRRALVLHELEGCSYAEISHHLGTSVSSVRSLLLRARRMLIALNESRGLPCAEVRARLDESTSPTVAIRRHLDSCSDCARYRRRLKRQPTRALRAISPVGALVALKGFVLARIVRRGASQATAGGAGAAGAGSAATAGAGGAATTGAGLSAAAAKALVGLAALAAAGTGTVVVQQAATGGQPKPRHHMAASSAPAVVTPASVASVIAASAPRSQALDRRSPVSKSKSSPASTTAPSSRGVQPSKSAGSGGQGSQSNQGSQGTGAANTSSTPATAGRTRPTPGSGMAPVRTRPLPVNGTNSEGNSVGGSSSGQGSSGQGSSTGRSSSQKTGHAKRRGSTQRRPGRNRPHRP